MSSTASDQPQAETIVLIHGMWMTSLSWESWVNHYADRGHRVLAPAWPGLDKEPEELRRDPSPLRGLEITDVVDHYDHYESTARVLADQWASARSPDQVLRDLTDRAGRPPAAPRAAA